MTRGRSRRWFLGRAGGALAAVLLGAGCGDERAAAPEVDWARLEPPDTPELSEQEPKYVEAARAFLVAVPLRVRARARALLPPEVHDGLEHGLLALSDVCPRDQVQLQLCETSRWFLCPSCGSLFDGLGDRTAGPAPRGMSLHRLTVDREERVDIATKPLLPGVAADVALVRHEPAGPLCA